MSKYVKGQRVTILPEQEGEVSRNGVITVVSENYGVKDDDGDIWEVTEEYLIPEGDGIPIIVYEGKKYNLIPIE